MGKGFTLIETLLTIVVFTLATSIISGLIILTYRTHSYNWQQSSAVNEARKGVETMVQEIRKARTGEDGSYPIEKAEDEELIFYSDIDKDGSVERVRYFLQEELSANSFKKEVTEAVVSPSGKVSYPSGQEQVVNLSSFVCNNPAFFRYFDWDNQEIAIPGSRLLGTKLVQVYLVINADPSKPSQNFELSSSAQIRNLKEE